MPEAIYKSSYGTLTKSETVIKERVYVVRGASKLLLGVPAIRSLGLMHEIPGTYSVKAVNQMPDNHSLGSGTKEDIVKQYVVSFPPIIIIIMYFLCFLGSRDFRVLVGHEILSLRCFTLLGVALIYFSRRLPSCLEVNCCGARLVLCSN